MVRLVDRLFILLSFILHLDALDSDALYYLVDKITGISNRIENDYYGDCSRDKISSSCSRGVTRLGSVNVMVEVAKLDKDDTEEVDSGAVGV